MNPHYAVTFTGPERAELAAVEAGETPLAPNDVAGRTVASLISPGTELAGYQGQWVWSSYPLTPGYAAVFEVTDTGREVRDLKPGDLAFCLGAHRSHQRFPREQVLPVPDGLAPGVAPFARLMGVTMSTLTTTTARPPAKVIVTGLGIIGHLGAKVFGACGYDVLAVDPSAARREIAARAGIRNLAPAIPVDDPEFAGRVALVVECSGHEQAALDACKVVQKRGEVVLVAAMWQRRSQIYAHDLLHAIFNRYAVLRSGWEWEVPGAPTDFRANSIRENLAAALRWLADGRVKVDGLAEAVSPRDAQAAYQQLLRQPEKGLTLLFDWSMV